MIGPLTTLAVLYSFGMFVTAIVASVWLQDKVHANTTTLRRIGVGGWSILIGATWPIVLPLYLFGYVGEKL